MIRIGAEGVAIEGGACALRTALALSCATGVAFRWDGFRRKGLSQLDAAAVQLFAGISGVEPAAGLAGDDAVELEPGPTRGGSHRFDVPAAEPMLPWLRAALAPLAHAAGESELVLTGTTHASGSETYEVTASTFRYLLHELGIEVSFALACAGFAPRGGGEVSARVAAGAEPKWSPVTLVERAPLDSIQIVSAGASLPAHVQQRQAARARAGVLGSGLEPAVQLVKMRARGAGSAIAVTGHFGEAPITFAAVSERGKSAEWVGEQAAAALRRYADQAAVVPENLVTSLLPFLALALGSSRISTPRLPAAVPGQAALIRAFTGREVQIEGRIGKPALVQVS